jgi:hypothetical protein
MDLVDQVVAALNVDPSKAERGIGAILMALRSSIDRETFERVRRSIPNSDHLMGRALMSGARTAEMAAVVGPAGLAAALSAAGYTKQDVPLLGRIVVGFLRPLIGEASADSFLASAPALKA